MTSRSSRTRVALVGVRGFGGVHLANLDRLSDRVELIGVADPAGPPVDGLRGARFYTDAADLLQREQGIDLVIVATPLHTHASIATAALRHGADVYVEKPPVSSMAAFDELLAAQRSNGRSVQVGFQALGSLALPALLDDRMGLGAIRGVSAVGLWSRARSYWSRSPWAGRRRLDGVDVVDGVATNALAHAVSTALRLAGATRREQVVHVETDLYRANASEADDASVVRVTTATGMSVTAALTLDAPTEKDPVVIVRGTEATGDFSYTRDVVVRDDGVEYSFGRVDLVENLLDHRDAGAPLLSPLADSGAFMTVLEAIRTAPDPEPVPAHHVTWTGQGDDARPTVDHIDDWVVRAADASATFRELGAPWALPRRDARLGVVTGPGRAGAVIQDGGSVTPTSSPRPYLHPITTPGGVVVTDHHPRDHDWHLGLGVAIQDVGGTNFWGGRTWVQDRGYLWRDDHGTIRSTALRTRTDGADQELEWVEPDGRVALVERRVLCSRGVEDAWSLTMSFSLTAQRSLHLGSPGSNGRVGAGYGGFMWRLAPCAEVDVRGEAGTGEAAVHGRPGAWVAWSARFEDGDASIAIAPRDGRTAEDPWFVRSADYPGLGSAIAWESPVRLDAGSSVTRSFALVIADGRRDDEELVRLLGAVR
ncbi:DUF6807 family protein [Pseudolysinimonas sp.]|uniref:DUF6807 family protein n=1 Tax=Pseudolysinimonas sp. TaxID=2680009 RepID=UPI003F7EB2D3